MVRGAILCGVRSPLTLIQCTLNALRYINTILERVLVPFLQYLTKPFQHDNALLDIAHVTLAFLAQNYGLQLPWPARSPDLNSIKHVWDMMDRKSVISSSKHFGIRGITSTCNELPPKRQSAIWFPACHEALLNAQEYVEIQHIINDIVNKYYHLFVSIHNFYVISKFCRIYCI